MKYFLENQRVLGFQSHAAGGWWLLGTRGGEGGCLVGSGLALDAPLSGDAGLAGGLPAQEAAPAAPPTAFQTPWLYEIMLHPQLPVGISTWSPG